VPVAPLGSSRGTGAPAAHRRCGSQQPRPKRYASPIAGWNTDTGTLRRVTSSIAWWTTGAPARMGVGMPVVRFGFSDRSNRAARVNASGPCCTVASARFGRYRRPWRCMAIVTKLLAPKDTVEPFSKALALAKALAKFPLVDVPRHGGLRNGRLRAGESRDEGGDGGREIE
jgi:hypothetical protein